MRCSETTTIVSTIPSHASDQATALEVLYNIDFILWLHTGKNFDALPTLFELAGVRMQVAPSSLCNSELTQ
jgi:hypothetical protein